MSDIMRIGVIGATGYVGGRLVPELLACGHAVTCIARTPSRLDQVAWRGEVDVIEADVLDRDSLVAAFTGLDAVYYLVHAMGSSPDFAETDRTSARNAQRAAEATGVGRLIYLGGLGDGEELSHHLSSRHEVGAILSDGEVPVTELRAAVIIGSGSASFEMLRHLVEVLPAMTCPRWVTRTRCQPIAIADVLRYLVRVLDVASTAGQILEIGGPDVMTYQDMMHGYAARAGLRKRIIIPVPLLTPRLSSHWVNLVTPLPIGLARPLVDSLINDVVVTPEFDVSRFIEHEPMSFEDAVDKALSTVQDLAVSTSWMDSAQMSSPASPRPQDPKWAGGTVLEDVREVVSSAGAPALFATVAGIGGERGWYFGNWLWATRGWIDKLLGGVGMRRGRRHPDDLRVGDALDFFRVEVFEPNHLLRLRAEMKLPGEAWLEWQVKDHGDGTQTLRQLARFHPRGIAGRLYWWLLLAPHALIFTKMIKRLADAAQQSDDLVVTPGSSPTG
jgi:uncharacterized protein YbjT (DUF2867 family)